MDVPLYVLTRSFGFHFRQYNWDVVIHNVADMFSAVRTNIALPGPSAGRCLAGLQRLVRFFLSSSNLSVRMFVASGAGN